MRISVPENEMRNMNNALKRITARKNLIMDLKNNAQLSYEDAEKIVITDYDFVKETMEKNESWTDIKRIIKEKIFQSYYDTREVSKLSDDELKYRLSEQTFIPFHVADEMIKKDRGFIESVVKDKDPIYLIETNSDMKDIYYSYNPENLDILNFPKILKANLSDIDAESIWPQN